MASVTKTLPRASHVGSFLRPKYLLAAREKHANGAITDAELRQVEDKAIKEVVEDQISWGLGNEIGGVTDGEFRRAYFHLDWMSKLAGTKITSNTLSSSDKDAKYVPPTLTVVGKIAHDKPNQLPDFEYLNSVVKAKAGVARVAIPSPTMAHFRAGRGGISEEAYPNLDDFFEDLAAAYREEVRQLYDAGCRFIQIDDTNLCYLCSEDMRAAAVARGEDLETLPNRYAKLINDSFANKPADLVVGLHACRGNFKGQWFSSGGYEPIAKTLFQDIKVVDVYLLEWESDRAGDFAPLRWLPKDESKRVILGLISSKIATLEDKEAIKAKIQLAASHAPLGLKQLGLSPQCGFASTHHGNPVQYEDQQKKMALVLEIVEEVWGKEA